MADPLAGWQKLGAGDLVASGLAKPGPLAGWVQQGADPAQNAQAIREGINPSPQPASAQGLPPDIQRRFERPFGLPKMPVAPASLAAPGAGYLSGILGQGVAGTGEALAQGRGPLAALKEGGMGAAGAGILGGLGHLALGLPAKASAAKKALGVFGEKTAAREASIKGMEEAHALTGKVNKEMTGVLNTMEKEGFEVAKKTHAEDAAKKVAIELKKNVPALSPFSADHKGLVDMIYGKGKAAVSRAFDKALKDVVTKGKGKSVQLSADATDALGLQGTGGAPASLSRVAREALERAGKLSPAGTVSVDAAELANAALGTWRKDPRTYRAAMDALDKANIGDPTARAAYKHYMGLSQFVDKTGALKGEVFNPEAFNAGMTKLKQVEEMRRRGIGSATEGYGGLARGGPLASTPRTVPPQTPMPSAPPEIPKPDIRTMKNPLAGHPYTMGMGTEAIAAGLGHHGFGIPFMGGMALSNAMPKELVTQASGVNPLIQALIQAITRTGGASGAQLAQ